ncbi:terpene synthase family protein (plasmid) [Streptomyces sp. BI20]|uniref:terpene synthase family protein n=1 Tax=Streptomyces sp. BI20 TaxID=3403460 RepID=UPI003C71669F
MSRDVETGFEPGNPGEDAVPVAGPPVAPGDLRAWPFDMPFPSRSSAQTRRVAAHSRWWVQHVGLADRKTALERHDLHDMSRFACLNYPDADSEGLDLIGDWVSWWAVWSDLPDDPGFLHDPGRAERFFASLTSVLTESVTESVTGAGRPRPAFAPDPHVIAFTDIWSRWCQGMSARFIARTGGNWADWFGSYRTRCEHRRTGRMLRAAPYLSLRDLTGAVRLEMDAIERLGGFEIPPALLDSPPLRAMRHVTTRVVSVTQDVQSLSKEEAAGDQHNFVLVLQRQDNLTREEALRRIHAGIRRHTDSFLLWEHRLPRHLDVSGLPVAEREPLYRYVGGLRQLMRGGYDFCATSDRYQ